MKFNNAITQHHIKGYVVKLWQHYRGHMAKINEIPGCPAGIGNTEAYSDAERITLDS